MNKTLTETIGIVGILAFVGFLVLVYLLSGVKYPAFAATQPGIVATAASSTNWTVNTSQIPVFATSTCAARVIQTASSTIMFTLDDKVASQTFGILQAASTTVAYDASIYGCGQWRVYSPVPQQITVFETR